MHHVLIDSASLSKDQKRLLLTGEDYHHIVRVLRMREGEELTAAVTQEAEDAANEYRFGIDAITEDTVICSLRFVKEGSRELPAQITLLQCLPKNTKMEQIIQKAVELGVYEVIPVAAKRCVVRLDESRGESKTKRWQKIAEAAAMQSKRGIIPEVTKPLGVREAIAYVKDHDLKLIPYELAGFDTDHPGDMEETRRLIASVSPGQKIAVFIGPEGGFEKEEVQQAADAGFIPVTLGKRILRTETAGIAVLSWLMFHLEA